MKKGNANTVNLVGVALLILCLSGEAIHVANTVKHSRSFSSLLQGGTARRSGAGDEAEDNMNADASEFLEMGVALGE
jgi:hypothetical protein